MVSAPVAEAMAVAARERFGATIGVATTGNAGPSKGDSDAELGTVYIALASQNGVVSYEFHLGCCGLDEAAQTLFISMHY